jgi:hypothetical protein
VPALDLPVEVLEQPDPRPVRLVGRELDEVECVADPERTREVGEKDDAGLQRCNQQGRQALVVGGDRLGELVDAPLELGASEVDLTDAAGP